MTEEVSGVRINAQRLLARLEELGRIGATAEGGVRRLALSDEDRQGRDQVVTWMRQAELDVRIDGIGNIFGTRPGNRNLAPVMTGSHIDSVANGGKLDGCYGVLSGIEVVDVLNEQGIETERPLVVAAFTNEEGARFQPDMMGSLVHAGGLAVEEALERRDDEGLRLGNELQRIGYAGDMGCGEIVPEAFVELHIEQGPVLEEDGVIIGAVENLQGISWTEVRIQGQANHAGTAPMRLRHDAGYCAAELTAEVRAITRDFGGTQVGTVGVIELQPNIINVVPSAARLTVDLRNTDNERLKAAEDRLQAFLMELAAQEGVEVKTSRLARFDPVTFDQSLVKSIEKTAAALGHSCQRMTSGAGHDAQMMARFCPSAMIFVPSEGGISHNPAERTSADHLAAGADVLLRTMLELAS